jgi:hypothetical protein
MINRIGRIVFGIKIFFLIPILAVAAQNPSLTEDLNRLASSSEYAGQELGESIAANIERAPGESSKTILAALSKQSLTDKQLAVYVWALGLTKDSSAIESIIGIHTRNKNELVQGNCLRALAQIGGSKSGNYLLSVLDSTSDKEKRYNIISLLAQMQYEPALPKAESILKGDAKQLYWQSVFVFGQMGDKSVPLLLKNINDKDFNVRANSIHVLGRWLMAPEAANQLETRFWVEQDKELRGLILSSLERTLVDLSGMKSVFKNVAGKEKDADLKKFAQETLDNMSKLQASIASYRKEKRISKTDFDREYASLYKTAGKKGDYKVLAVSSSYENEQQLKTLKERILQRGSDEAFYDYEKVNDIILKNRLSKFN